MAVACPGLRVVRGPDWRWGLQDGGEGGVGTVVEVGGKADSNSPEDTAVIQWDLASKTNYRCGYEDSHDIRVLDTASAGIQHFNVTCDKCKDRDIFGIRWKCRDCPDYDLCNWCYHDGAHDLEHRFFVMPTADSPRMEVDARNGAMMVMAKGMFSGAKISRGPDWQWGDQDGGTGTIGELEELRNWETESVRSVAQVLWPNGQRNVYRLGHAGKIDIRCVEPADGGNYYRDHLPLLVMKDYTSVENGDGDEICVGTLVHVMGLDIEIWRTMQDGHGGWVEDMEKVYHYGMVGEVVEVEDNSDLQVWYPRLTVKFRVHPAAVTAVTKYDPGDKVKMIDDLAAMKALLINHGEWTDGMIPYIGRMGIITNRVGNFDVRAKFGPNTWLFHPGCLELLSRAEKRNPVSHDVDDEPYVAQASQGSADSDSVEARHLEALRGKFTGSANDNANPAPESMHSPPDMQEILRGIMTGVAPAAALAKAIQERDVDSARAVLERNREYVNAFVGEHEQRCLHIAAGLGYVDMINLLAEFGANFNVQDRDGDTAVHFAVHGDEAEAVQALFTHGANIDACNHKASTPLHVACYRNHLASVKELIQMGANVNHQDSNGETPLFDAVSQENTSLLGLLMDGGADVNLTNDRGFNVVHHGALRGSHFTLQALLQRVPEAVNSSKEDGFHPLHLAAFNNHVGVATVLLRHPHCEIDPVNDDKRTPLMMAVLKGLPGCCELLVSYGANLEAEDNEGDTVLHMALFRQTMADIARLQGVEASVQHSPVLDSIRARMGFDSDDDNKSSAIACFLAQEGCSLTYRNHKGKTPLDMCVDPKVRKLVESYSKPKGWSPFHGSNKIGGFAPLDQLDGSKEKARAPVPTTSGDGKQMTVIVTDPLPNCSVCDNKANIRFMPCGHNTMCAEHTKRATRCPEKGCKSTVTARITLVHAPSLSTKLTSEASEDGDDQCMMCDKRATVNFEPCGHVVTCLDCCVLTRKCVQCKTIVTKMTHEGKLVQGADTPAPNPTPSAADERALCPICFDEPKQVAFFCGHQTCKACGDKLFECAICRKPITHRIQLFS